MPGRWIALRTAAAIALLGSLATILLAALMFFGATITPPRGSALPPGAMKAVAIGAGLFFLALSGWGIATAVGIFRRRAWARISMLVFAGLGAVMSGSGLLTVAFLKLPASAGSDPRIIHSVQFTVLSIYGLIFAVAVWWLILYSLPSTRAYFAEATAPAESAQPLSIRIIGWYLIASAVMMAVLALLRLPTVFLGALITGWASAGVFTALAAVNIYLGAGLLQFDHNARIGAIVYFALLAANGLIMAARPDQLRRAVEAMPYFPKYAQTMPDMTMPLIVGAAVALVPVWFLANRWQARISPPL